MSQTGAQFGHLVDLVDTLAGQEVQSVQVLVVLREEQLLLWLFNGDDGLEDSALAVLNPLTHGVQVGGKVDRGGEDALLILALRLAVELFPPLADEVQLGLVVDHDFNLLASLVETVAHGSILGGRVLVEGNAGGTGFLHVLSTGHQLLDVETGTGNGQQTNRGEHGEASAHVVGNDERLVALLVCTGAGGTALGISDGHDDLAGLLLATLSLALLLQQTEGEGGLGGCARLGNIDDAKLLVLQVLGELEEIVLANVVAGKEDGGVLLVLNEPAERVAQRFDDGTGSQVGTANAGHDHGLAIVAQRFGAGLYLVKKSWRNLRGQVQPAQKVVAGTGTILQSLLCGLHLWFESLYCSCLQEAGGLRNVKFDVVHNDFFIV